MKGKHGAITIFLMIMVLSVSFSVNTFAQEAAGFTRWIEYTI